MGTHGNSNFTRFKYSRIDKSGALEQKSSESKTGAQTAGFSLLRAFVHFFFFLLPALSASGYYHYQQTELNEGEFDRLADYNSPTESSTGE